VVGASVFRLYAGGVGTLPGLLVIITSGMIGLAWRRWLYPKSKKWRWLNTYAMSITVHATMLVCMLTLPYPTNLNVICKIAVPVKLIYPVIYSA
jgi:LytS/YehU family sensor histidine kinase